MLNQEIGGCLLSKLPELAFRSNCMRDDSGNFRAVPLIQPFSLALWRLSVSPVMRASDKAPFTGQGSTEVAT